MCLGVASEKAGKGEKWLSSQNRNFENRMGEGSLAHLASAATVAASAYTMQISDPRPLLAQVDQAKFRAILGERKPRRTPELRNIEPQPHLAPAGATAATAREGWGSGSSREQAVLALKGAGVEAIIARSYAFIHKRNLVNEAVPFLVVHDAAFYELAKEGEPLEVDLASGQVHIAGQTFAAE